MSTAIRKEAPSSTSASTQPVAQNIRLTEKVGYGFGDLASNLVWTAMSMFITFFYTDVAGIAAGVIGTIMLFSRIFDGVTDIGMGILVDKTNSKHGKARPWLLWMAVPFAVSAVLLFAIPDLGTTGKIVYAVITYNLLALVYTAINIPYGVLNSLISQDQYQRSQLNIYRMFMAIGGALIVSVCTMPIVSAFGGGQRGWIFTFAVYGIVGALLFLAAFYTTKERVAPSNVGQAKSTVPVKVGTKALFKNKYWVVTLLFFVVTYISMGLGQGTTIYFAQYILGKSELVGLLSIAGLIPMMAGMLVVGPLIKKIGKRNAMVAGLILTIIGSLLTLVDTSNVTLVMTGAVLKGIGTVPVIASIFAMLADTIEYGEWKSGVRTEGLVYSAGSFGAKVGTGVGTALVGWVLSWGGYVGGQATQSDNALLSINALFIYIPLALTIIQIALLMFYKLDKEYPNIIKELQRRNGSRA